MADILLPFIHLTARAEDTADMSKRTDVGALVTNERRVVFAFNKNREIDPSAALDFDANLEQYYMAYCFNQLRGLQYNIFGSNDNVYVTHLLKNLPALTQLDGTTYRTTAQAMQWYLEDTAQDPEDFALGLVLDTSYTVHPVYVRCRLLSVDQVFAQFELRVPYTTPWVNATYMESLYAHYPIKVIAADLKLTVTGSGDGHYKTRVTCSVDITENKRAVL